MMMSMSRLRLIPSLGDGIGNVLPDDVVRGAGVGRGRDAGELKSSCRLLVEVELLEFLLRLTEVLFIPIDGSRPHSLSPVRREESVQTVWRESLALRYSLSDVLVPASSAVAAAQLAPIASCAVV